MFNLKLKSSLDKFKELFKEALQKAVDIAVKATANDVIKVTLPNTLNNVPQGVPASKLKGTFKNNLKMLKQRITSNIIGNGMEGGGIPTGVPGANGNPIPSTVKGKSYMPFMLAAKRSGSGRRIDLTKAKAKLRIASSVQDFINHLKKTTYLSGSGVAYRRRKKGSEMMWITKPAIAKGAAKELSLRAGNLLSGWSALAAKTGNTTLGGLISSQKVDSQGSADLQKGTVTKLKATNKEVNSKVASYQQRVVDSSMGKSFKYHLQNAINRINFNTLKNKAK